MNWEPGASAAALQARAALLACIRQFFAAADVLEVETPLLCEAAVTDPNIEALCVNAGAVLNRPRYLQTSPEYAMKRLLAAGSGPIYQIARAFRDGEAGGRHNPEFSMLEWYRPGYDEHQLMDEVAALVCACLGQRPWQTFSYRQLFLQHLQVDPWAVDAAELRALAGTHLDVGDLEGDVDMWLDLLLSHVIEPQLPAMCFVHDYPPSQAALARIDDSGELPVARRFELYVEGIELANGYFELLDAPEQRRRFEADNLVRRERGLGEQPLDERLLAAMEQGLPSCAGVALGVDRLLMLQLGESDIRRVLAFDWQRC